MSSKAIRAALEMQVQAWAAAQSPAIPVQFENDITFERPAGGARYARCFVLPAPTATETVDRLHREYVGLLQVTLCMPLGSGNAGADELCASLDAALSPAMPLQNAGVRVHLTRPMSRASGIPEPDCYAVPVSGAYRADTYPA